MADTVELWKKKAKKHVSKVNHASIDLGEALYNIKKQTSAFYVNQFAINDLGISKGKVAYLIDVFEMSLNAKVDKGALASIGICKLKLLAQYEVMGESLERDREWLFKASKMNLEELEDVLKGGDGQKGGLLFSLPKSKRALFVRLLVEKGAIRRHGKVKNKNEALIRLLDAYVEMQSIAQNK